MYRWGLLAMELNSFMNKLKLLHLLTSHRSFSLLWPLTEVHFQYTLPNAILKKKIIVPGLCGAVHTSVARHIRTELGKDDQNVKVVCVGDKSRAILSRIYGKNIILAANEVGRLPPTFLDAAKLADAILKSDYKFGAGEIVYNRFKSVVSYQTQTLPVFSLQSIAVSVLANNFGSVFEPVWLRFRLLRNCRSTILSTTKSSSRTWSSRWRPFCSTQWKRELAPSSLPEWQPWTMLARTPARWLTSLRWRSTELDRLSSPENWLKSFLVLLLCKQFTLCGSIL